MPAEGGERQPPERIANGNHDAAGLQQLRPAANCGQPFVSGEVSPLVISGFRSSSADFVRLFPDAPSTFFCSLPGCGGAAGSAPAARAADLVEQPNAARLVLLERRNVSGRLQQPSLGWLLLLSLVYSCRLVHLCYPNSSPCLQPEMPKTFVFSVVGSIPCLTSGCVCHC